MISMEPRCIYARNPLAEVICQLRFPEILSIETELPAVFQEQIRDVFPRFSQRKEGLPGKQTNNYQFTTADGNVRVNLTSKFISLAATQYRCWEEFARLLDKPLAAFIQTYKPAYFERIGLRYVNFISRKALSVESIPYRELIAQRYLGIMSDEQIAEPQVGRSGVDAEIAIRGGCRVKLHAGPGQVHRGGKSDGEVKFIFDQDLYMPGKIAPNLTAPALHTLHTQAWSIFRDAITDELHDAMEPTR
jgi:uncharacterized protein (TIGR04255 family)